MPLDVAALLRETGALLSGHFRLSSGLHSAGYVQCALLLEHPRNAKAIGTDAKVLQAAYNRGDSFQAVYARLESADAFGKFKDALTTNPQLNVKVLRHVQLGCAPSRHFLGAFRLAPTRASRQRSSAPARLRRTARRRGAPP